ncbi:U1 small nuclear ribonucleoprotein component SNU71 [Candida viswanathii]|uniref:U1 small nuclear ribonucleoprotein component SNU71 n=1 Tax=Candida viswanathii TaxID=5486 RepID=A0A367YPE2_9ASCO|nr:U1 small nuclear ribonucleoprotein component SNU71 [Candida viswanathii]
MTTDESIITYVDPYKLPESNNADLISLLAPNNTAATRPESLNFQIPVLKSIDVSNLIDLNTTKIQTQVNEQKRSSKATNKSNTTATDTDDNVVDINDIDLELDEDLLHFIPIEEFQFKNLHNQISSVSINGFPNDLKPQALEKILNLLIHLDDEDKKRRYKWSAINLNNTIVDLKLIFIKFDHVADLKWFLATYSMTIGDIIPGAAIIPNDLIGDTLDSLTITPSSVPESLKSKVSLTITSPKNKATKKVTGLEDLDQVLDSYSNYKVDNNDLIDIPNDMKESIVKDIIKFRSRMLLMEKDLRKREIEHERIKTKQKLKRLFEGIKETTTDGTTTTTDSPMDVLLPTSNREEYEDMNEEEYEKYLQNQETVLLEEEYKKRKAELAKNQDKELAKLSETLDKLKGYENHLVDNKLKHIDDLKNYESLGLSNLYTHKYNDYLRIRSQKRTLEEEQDELDRAEELKEAKVETPVEEAVAAAPAEPAAKKTKVEIIISELPGDVKSSLNDKIVELVEEYLGVKDEFLVQVINDNLESHNLSRKKELIDDLVEVLDEDSENLVNDLWNYIEQLK